MKRRIRRGWLSGDSWRYLCKTDWSHPLTHILGWGLPSQFTPFCYFQNFLLFIKIHDIYWILCLYLTGVTAAQLWWHLSNINKTRCTFARSKNLLTDKLTNRALVNPTPGCWADRQFPVCVSEWWQYTDDKSSHWIYKKTIWGPLQYRIRRLIIRFLQSF